MTFTVEVLDGKVAVRRVRDEEVSDGSASSFESVDERVGNTVAPGTQVYRPSSSDAISGHSSAKYSSGSLPPSCSAGQSVHSLVRKNP